MSTTIRAVGIPWYTREDYARILTIMADAQVMPTAWEEWFQRAKNGRDHLRAHGYIVEEVYIDPDTFPEWCRGNGYDVDTKGRAALANSAVHTKFGTTN